MRIDTGARGDTRQRRAIQSLRPTFVLTPLRTTSCTARYGECVNCNPTSGAFTVTMPPAKGHKDDRIQVKNNSASTNTITIAFATGETGDVTSIATARASITFHADGASRWLVT